MITNPLNQIALDWAIRSFGADHVRDKVTRALRVAEEAVELAQAEGVTREKMHHLVDIVYSRPVGDAFQEVGGVLLTACVHCASRWSMDFDEPFVVELRRVLGKSPEHFRKRNAEKDALGLIGSEAANGAR